LPANPPDVPSSSIPVAAVGISGRADAQTLADHPVDTFLLDDSRILLSNTEENIHQLLTHGLRSIFYVSN